MKSMSRLIIDITELAYWQGKLTGVPRVMNELTRRYAARSDVVFVVWNSTKRVYKEIDPPHQQLDQDTNVPEEPSSNPSQKYAQIIEMVKRAKRSSKIANKTLSIPERAARKLLKPKPFADLGITVVPQKEDTLLVMADWHASDESFISYIEDVKARGTRIVQICYDMLPVIAPQYSGHATEAFTEYVTRVYPLCDLILAISKSTKNDIESWLTERDLRAPNVEVIRLGDDFKLAKPQAPTDKFFISNVKPGEKFLLCVGTIEARKNHALLYYTYKLAKNRGITLPKLVIVGRIGWRASDVFSLITSDPDTKDVLLPLQKVSDEELAWLYKNCLFSVYPSFYEGWGLPIAESLAYGVPCLSSNTSSMPEIAGDLVYYFSPQSTDECLTAIITLLDQSKLEAAREKTKAYRSVSWDGTFETVQSLVGKA